MILVAIRLKENYWETLFSQCFLRWIEGEDGKEENFPLDSRRNKLNKVSLLITEMLNFLSSKKRRDEYNAKTKIIFHFILADAMEAKMLNCSTNATQQRAEEEKAKFLSCKFS